MIQPHWPAAGNLQLYHQLNNTLLAGQCPAASGWRSGGIHSRLFDIAFLELADDSGAMSLPWLTQ